MQSTPRRTLSLLRSPIPAAIAVVALSAIGTAVAVAEHLPYGFGGHGHANDVWGDFVSGNGTALSPPWPALVIVVVLALLTSRVGRVGSAARIGLTIGAGAFLIGILGEPLTHRVLNPAHLEPFKAVLVALGLIASLTMGLTAARGIRGTRTDQPCPSGDASPSWTRSHS
jgi:hypothetical protein